MLQNLFLCSFPLLAPIASTRLKQNGFNKKKQLIIIKNIYNEKINNSGFYNNWLLDLRVCEHVKQR